MRRSPSPNEPIMHSKEDGTGRVGTLINNFSIY